MKKSKDLRLRIEPDVFDEFSHIAKKLNMPVSQVVRRLMARFIEQNHNERQSALFPVAATVDSPNRNTIRPPAGE